MVKMDANQRQGAVAEMRVALAFVEQGCAVNNMTQMDFGMDLNVQVPNSIPAPSDDTWEMSQRTANLQVKSSRSAGEKATVPYAVAAEWGRRSTRTSPTFLVLCIDVDYYLFSTLTIRRLADKTFVKKRKKLMRDVPEEYWSLFDPPDLGKTGVSFSSSNGFRVSRDELPQYVIHWTNNAEILDTLSGLDVDLFQGIGPGDEVAVLKFIGLAVAAYANHFFDYEAYKHKHRGGSEQTYELARDMILATLGSRRMEEKATTVVGRIPITPSGWDRTPPLQLFTSAVDIEGAAEELVRLAKSLSWAPRPN